MLSGNNAAKAPLPLPSPTRRQETRNRGTCFQTRYNHPALYRGPAAPLALRRPTNEGVLIGPTGMQAGAGAFCMPVAFPQATRGQSDGRNPLSRQVPAGYSAFSENGTRNAEPHILEASVTTIGAIISRVMMHATHRRSRRGLRLQTRRITQTKGAAHDAGFSALTGRELQTNRRHRRCDNVSVRRDLNVSKPARLVPALYPRWRQRCSNA